VGGASVTEEIWPGYKVSTAAYVLSLLRREVVRDLNLKKHGLIVYPQDPTYFQPYPDGRYLMIWNNYPKSQDYFPETARRESGAARGFCARHRTVSDRGILGEDQLRAC
jgi:phytoene dehydrogenase-like protein